MPRKKRPVACDVPEQFVFKAGKHCGKTLAEIRYEARYLIMDQLLRATNISTSSLVGHMAHTRLLALAKAMDPEMFDKLTADINRMHTNMARVLNTFMLTPAERKRKYASKARRRRR